MHVRLVVLRNLNVRPLKEISLNVRRLDVRPLVVSLLNIKNPDETPGHAEMGIATDLLFS